MGYYLYAKWEDCTHMDTVALVATFTSFEEALRRLESEVFSPGREGIAYSVRRWPHLLPITIAYEDLLATLEVT
jgi:hypothetical protein